MANNKKENEQQPTKKVSKSSTSSNTNRKAQSKSKKTVNKNSTTKTKSNALNKIKTNKKVKTVDINVVDKEIKSKLGNNKTKVNIMNNDNSKNSSFSLLEVILMIIITILTCTLVGYFVMPDTNVNVNNQKLDKEVQTFLEQYNYILDNYYGDIDKQQLINDAIKGMFSSLDDYSEVIDEDSNSFTITLQGEYEGVGIEIANDVYGNIIILNVYENTPAYKAGIRANDVLIRFNDIDLNGKTTTELVGMIASGSEMSLTVLRNDKEITVNVKREKIILESVKSKMLENKIGYIDIDIFAANTKEQFEKALNDLEKNNMKSLIIDLRDNTGGHLSAVEEMLYLLLDKNHVIYQTEDKNGTEKTYSKGTKDKEYKIVILQNGLSASASEIMAAALSEELDSYIIGNTSFGKGTVQTLKDVNEDFQYKFTTKRWLTPKGNWINGVGIKPDLEVILSEKYYENPTMNNDNQLKAAIDYLNK